MPSSFVDSVPPIMKRIIELNPKRVVDVGPGWGKYGLMCREYLPDLLFIEAIEVKEGRVQTQEAIYANIYTCDVRDVHDEYWNDKDLVLIIDVIEHMPKKDGQELLTAIVNAGGSVLVSTPKVFTEQHDEHNPHEEHICVWTWEDFWYPGMVEVDKIDDSTIDSVIMTLTPRKVEDVTSSDD